jgi:prophage antirepressor-like protein
MSNSTAQDISNSIVPFDFEGQQIRVIRDEQGDVWFIATDVCRVLGYSNPSKALSDNLDDEERSDVVQLTGVRPGITGSSPLVINESGLYTLMIRSRDEKAKPFRKWVTSEVLPAIRRTGYYSITQSQDPMLAMIDMLKEQRLAQLEIEKRQSVTEQRVSFLEAQNIALDTTVTYFTVKGYHSRQGKQVSESEARVIGKDAAKLSRQLGYSIGKAPDPLWGSVNTYHEYILRQVLGW